MSCTCVTGSRRLRVNLPTSDSKIRLELAELDYWQATNSGDWSVPIGSQSPYKTVEDLVNFLESIECPQLLEEATGYWEQNPSAGCCSDDPYDVRTSDEENCAKRLTEMCDRTVSQLTTFLQDRAITTFFQPVVEPDGTTIWGYECLMRGVEKSGVIMAPFQLLQWAKAENLTSMLDRICREAHLRNAAKLIPAGKNILINFIPTAIYEPAFCLRSTMEVLRQTGIDPRDVIFEVVETEQVRDVQHLNKILDYYREHGFRTALDDVGAGFSGLNLLASLRPDLLKLDMELVQGAEDGLTHRIIVQGLIQIAKNCGQLVLAEGIETLEQFRMMREFGVDLFQGY